MTIILANVEEVLYYIKYGWLRPEKYRWQWRQKIKTDR